MPKPLNFQKRHIRAKFELFEVYMTGEQGKTPERLRLLRK
jgi:hypothetical protein